MPEGPPEGWEEGGGDPVSREAPKGVAGGPETAAPAAGAPPEPPTPEARRRRLMRTALALYGFLMAVPLWWQAASEGPNLFFPRGFSVPDTIGGLVTGVLAGLALVGFSSLTTRHTRWGRRLASLFAETLGRLSARDVWALALLSGFGEEMFFRGLLQPYLGLVATSVLFGLVHFVPRREFIPWTIFSLGAGFLLGGLYAFAGTLVSPIACHVLVNGINLGRITRDA